MQLKRNTFLTFALNALVAIALLLVTGVAAYASPTHNTALPPHENIDLSDYDQQAQPDHSHKCHGRVSCEIQTTAMTLRPLGSLDFKSEVFVMSLSTDRSIYSLHPEPPPPEA